MKKTKLWFFYLKNVTKQKKSLKFLGSIFKTKKNIKNLNNLNNNQKH